MKETSWIVFVLRILKEARSQRIFSDLRNTNRLNFLQRSRYKKTIYKQKLPLFFCRNPFELLQIGIIAHKKAKLSAIVNRQCTFMFSLLRSCRNITMWYVNSKREKRETYIQIDREKGRYSISWIYEYTILCSNYYKKKKKRRKKRSGADVVILQKV